MGPKAHIAAIMLMSLVFPNTAFGVMSSTSYQIQWDSVGTGGSDTGSSTNYQMRDTLGNTAIGGSASSTYDLRSGYRQGINDQFISFTLIMQDSSSQTAASALTGTTVTVSSLSGYSVDDFALIVQDQGLNQVSGFGKVTSASGSTLVLDSLTTSGTTPIIDGTGDFVYRLTTSATPTFSSISEGAVSTTTFAWQITSVSQNGHTVYVYDSGNLSAPSGSDINDVSDGVVSAGSEEAGARSSDTSLASSTFDTVDTAITTSNQAIGTEASDVYGLRQFLTMKMSISPTTPSGTYTNSTIVIATGNF